jgi:hypothetical protein
MKHRLHRQTRLCIARKHFACQLVLATLWIGGLQARPVHTQSLLERIVTVHLDQTDVSTFLSTIEQSTGVHFVYSSKAIGAKRKISVHQNNQKLSVVLESALKPLSIGFRLVENSILLHRSTAPPNISADYSPTAAGSVFLDRAVGGKVTDEKGNALPGVSFGH